MDSYNYYFFDLDGTISESAPGIVKAVKYGLDQAGIKKMQKSSTASSARLSMCR